MAALVMDMLTIFAWLMGLGAVVVLFAEGCRSWRAK